MSLARASAGALGPPRSRGPGFWWTGRRADGCVKLAKPPPDSGRGELGRVPAALPGQAQVVSESLDAIIEELSLLTGAIDLKRVDAVEHELQAIERGP